VIDLQEQTRGVSGSRLLDLFRAHDIGSVVDPFMGVPTHLNYLKRHGIQVHGGDLVDWLVRAGEGLVVNDVTVLRENEVAEIVEMLPGQIYPVDLFRAWEGVFFTEEQCRYLGVWHANVHALRSDGQTGLAVLGLWHVLCYWLQKAYAPDEMLDVPPSELAWQYIREMDPYVCANNRRNTVRRADFNVTLSSRPADCAFITPPSRKPARQPDARIWMWEAWWQGDPYLNIEHYYRDTVFGRRTSDDGSYDRALSSVLDAAGAYPYAIIQTTPAEAARFERLLGPTGRRIEAVSPGPSETYIVAKK
jgi:hypothetical protein